MSARFAVRGGVDQLRPGAARAAAAACHLGVPEVRRHAVELAVHEGLANALEHGHLGDPERSIDVEVAADDRGRVTVRITDGALGAPARGHDDAAADGATGGREPRGRGRALIRASVDRVGERWTEGTLVLEWFVEPNGFGAPADRSGRTRHAAVDDA